MSKKDYRIYEGLRFASCLTFISGFMNAFTLVTQGGRFAGIQSGNVVYFAYYLAQGHVTRAVPFLLPIFFFMLGQCLTYLARSYCVNRGLPWHLSGSLIMTALVLLAIILNPMIGHSLTIAILSLAASVQIETFRHLRGAPYTNVMMTGNLKNSAYLAFKGWMEKDKALFRQGGYILLAIISFGLGVALSTSLSLKFGESALCFLMLPSMYLNYQLWQEKQSKDQSQVKISRK
ncbi:YoaK family protein [Streptococcus cuniculipharyngis]|uniref:DUF1275 domain-containing protein n=1 Tax=Streptococcus cuniculipharyngis TaxID=1562651 RepID=A0A5C5SC95_9STRE|nr:YoaK family protein [Streptococcus cuniculipharyngis]TWS97703.1 DUF1275 domain-containing protein [Streptococcus cuniculipharyngis]